MTDGPAPGMMTVFINAQRVLVAAGATVIDAVRVWSADAALEVERGVRHVTDSRGLPTSPHARVHGGAIFRLVATRDRHQADDESTFQP